MEFFSSEALTSVFGVGCRNPLRLPLAGCRQSTQPLMMRSLSGENQGEMDGMDEGKLFNCVLCQYQEKMDRKYWEHDK